jgi:hypothetical protein
VIKMTALEKFPCRGRLLHAGRYRREPSFSSLHQNHRKIGLGCDSLKSATVVTADGNLVTANEADNRDLFWGLRGSGWNFGVVTSMEFQLHPIGPSVVAGLVARSHAVGDEGDS